MKRQKVKAKRGVTAERASQATCRQQISWRCHCTFPLDASEYYHTVHGVKEKKKGFCEVVFVCAVRQVCRALMLQRLLVTRVRGTKAALFRCASFRFTVLAR